MSGNGIYNRPWFPWQMTCVACLMVTGVSWAGQRIIFSTPGGGGTITNLLDSQVGLQREELIRQGLQDELFKGSSHAPAASTEGVRPAQPSFSPAQARRLKDLIDQQKYWMFETPEDLAKSPADGTGNDVLDTGEDRDRLNGNTPGIVKKFLDRNSGNVGSSPGSSSRPQSSDSDFSSAAGMDGLQAQSVFFGANPALNGQSHRDASQRPVIAPLFDSANGINVPGSPTPGWGGAFGSLAGQPAQMDTTALDAHRAEFQKVLDFGSATQASVDSGSLFGTTTPDSSVNAGAFGRTESSITAVKPDAIATPWALPTLPALPTISDSRAVSTLSTVESSRSVLMKPQPFSSIPRRTL